MVVSVSTVPDYGKNDWVIGVRSPVERRNFSCNVCLQTGYGAHPAYCTIGTGGPFPGGKTQPGRDASVEVKNV
jgi:hypothetical protein